jgi:hypothetical protein
MQHSMHSHLDRRRGALLLAACMFVAVVGRARAAGAPSPAEIAAHRQEILDDMLSKDPPYAVAAQRWVCAMGQEPAGVTKSRSEGATFFPDAADSCVTALVRTARDRQLPALYGRLLAELGGNREGYERLPRTIGATVLNGTTKAAIGGGKAVEVTPALAFDAGFTVAYLDGAANQGAADARQLKTLTESCLAQGQDAGTCFSVGYASGANAFRARTASTR